MKKGRLTFSGRKPLGDLSNSRKPLPLEKVVTKKKNFGVIEEEIGARAKKDICKASDRDSTGNRKALSDISNSGKPHKNETSKKKQNIKLTAVTEESFYEKILADEIFLHNHEECIKAKNEAMDMDHFLQTVELANGFLKELPILDRSVKKFDCSPPKSHEYYPIWDGYSILEDTDDCISFKLLDTP